MVQESSNAVGLPTPTVTNRKTPPAETKTPGGSGDEDDDLWTTSTEKEQQLSADLALFLSNPSLQAALADGSLELTSYSSTVQEEWQTLESQCIAAYREHASEMQDLLQHVKECDSILMGLQEMLLGFQADLSGLSGDIQQLQEQSRALHIQLRNRQDAEGGLSAYLERIIIAPNLVRAIVQGPVNGNIFVESVQELRQVVRHVHEKSPQEWSCNVAPNSTVAAAELQEYAMKLQCVAISRIREYFSRQMTLFKSPQTNIRMIQVHGLLKYAALEEFLAEAAPEICAELFQVYVESMSQTLYALFRTYQAQLQQLDSTKLAATRQDVIAIDEASLREATASQARSKKQARRVDVFCLGDRAKHVLNHNNNQDNKNNNNNNNNTVHEPILAHVALAEHTLYSYERLFKSILGHLVEAVTNEHVFCRLFFKRDAFAMLFPQTLSLLLEQLEHYLWQCHDAIALLLMIQVVHGYKRILQQRTIYSLHAFLDQVTHLLWPRLKTVMDAHLRSIKAANVRTLGGVDLHAHYVSRRYAEFTCSLLLILHKTSAGNNNNAAAGSRNNAAVEGNVGPASASSETNSDKQQTKPAATTSSAPISPKPPSRRGSSNISNSKSAGEQLLHDIGVMQDEFLLLLERLADEHLVTSSASASSMLISSQSKHGGAAVNNNKHRIVFMINNLDQIVCLFQERRVAGKEFGKFVELLMAQRELFVEEELQQVGFSKLIAFVQQTENHLAEHLKTNNNASSNLESLVNVQVVQALVQDFSLHWKPHMEQINRNVLSYFSNFRNGMEILKQVLTQLLLYYTRFQDVIRKVWRSQKQLPMFCKDLVSTTTLLAEIKKYALAI